MNELIKTNQNDNDEIIVSGRDLHSFLGITTPYTMWFKRMVEYGFVEGTDFITKMLESVGGRPGVDHHIKLDMAKEVSMLQRNEKGKQARQYFIKVEKMWNDPEMIVKRALDLQQKKIYQLETKIQEEKKYTDFGKVISLNEGAINVGAFAKLMYDEHDLKIGRNKLMAWLRDEGYLITQGREKNYPKQKYVERGWFRLATTVVKRSTGDFQNGTTLITGKGQVELSKILLSEYSA